MKTLVLNRSLIIMMVCAGTAFSPIKAQQVEIDPATISSGSTARLVVNRSADFGINEVVDLFVDGAKVATLGYNGSYQGELPTGKHVLSWDVALPLPSAQPRRQRHDGKILFR